MGFFGGGGVASSAAQGATSNARDPAVRRTGTSTGTQTRGSSPRPPSRKPTQLERSVYNFTGNIARDLTMGLSTFGQSGERQAQTLRDRGYSDDVISDYQARTAASAARRSERLASRGSGGDDDNRPAPARVLAPARAGSNLPVRTSLTPTPPPVPSADAEPEPGSAEEAVVEGAKTRKGRASTIATSPTGLLTTAKTRRRRSLMGGEEPMGLIE